jgi:signal transduction histidine kinase/ligand-binding sensor domain-containing protein
MFRLLPCLFVSLFLSQPALAAGLKFEAWTSDDGLPQNSVYSILQTRDGYLWFTTLGGLVRYDGVRFTFFNRSNSSGITGNRFTTLHEDRDGNLWVGTEGGDVTCLRDGQFTTYNRTNGLPEAEIRAIRTDAEGRLWVFSSKGLVRWENEKFLPVDSAIRKPDQVGLISSTRRQTGFSFFDHEGLHVFEHGQFKTYTSADGTTSLNINAVFEDQHGAFWIETKDAGLYRLKNGEFTVFPIQNSLASDETRMTAALEDRQGNVWVARRGQGLSLWRNGTLQTYTAANGLASNDIETIYEDREGNIWLGTFNNGLSRVGTRIFSVISEREGLGFKNVYPILEDSKGIVWIGTWGGDLYQLKNGVFTHYGKKQGLSYQAISSLYEDSAGTLWVGTFGGGLNRLIGNRFESLTRKDGLPDLNVRAITQDRDGAMWFGTTGGLARYKDGSFKVYDTADGLPNREVQAITIDRAGNLWVGTLGGVVKLTAGSFTPYTEREGLSSNNVRVIHEDVDGAIWIGTYDGGITRIKDGRLTVITTREGLYDNGAFQILDDDDGNFWISCNRGIYQVSRGDLNDLAEGKRRSVTTLHYGKADGLLNTECNGGTQPAGFKARDGRLWFPTQDGIGIVNPKDITKNNLPPPVAIEEFMLDNRAVVFRDSAQFPTGTESFEIHYTGLSFIRPDQVTFKYKFDGLDDSWVEAGTRRTAYYSHLPPGTYTFRLIAANSDGVWNMEGAHISITIAPPFWRTRWFALVTIGFFTTLVVLAYRMRISQLQKKQRAQEAFSRQLIESQESERKRIAAELHDSIGQNLLVIKNRAMMALNRVADPERAKKQLDEISSTASESINEVREIAYDLHPYQLDRLGLTKAIEEMLKRVSDASGIHISQSIEPLDGVFAKDVEINLFRIVQEGVNNIVKHSQATNASVTIHRHLPLVHVNISDDGSGFATDSFSETGLGLKGMRERVRILGGRFTINSSSSEGATITVILPAQIKKHE